MELGITLGSFVVFIALGMPIAFAMMAVSVLYALISDVNIGFLAIEMFGSINSFVLIAIPMFILTAEVMNCSTIAERIFNFASSLVGRTPGGIGHVNIIANTIFAGMSGSAVADAGGIGKLCLDAMIANRYERGFSAALTCAAAVIGPIIPPSIPMVVYAMVANVSIGKLFLGGAIPGVIIAILLMIYTYYVSLKKGYPRGEATSFRKIVDATRRGILPLLTPAILLGGITLGVVTVTEASVLAVIYSCALGLLLYRTLSPREFWAALKRVFVTVAPIMAIFPASRMLGYVFTAENVPQQFADTMLDISSEPMVLMLLINLLFVVLGCFSDPNVNIMLFVPMVLPLVPIMNIDPIHFGLIIVLNTMIGLVTPPVGGLLFTVCGIQKMPFDELVRAIWPVVIVLFIALIIVILVPSTVTFLPNLLFRR